MYFDNGLKPLKINRSAILLIKKIMQEEELEYGCDLFLISNRLERMTTQRQRELWSIDSTCELSCLLNYMKGEHII